MVVIVYDKSGNSLIWELLTKRLQDKSLQPFCEFWIMQSVFFMGLGNAED
jgi:hypothetical protein